MKQHKMKVDLCCSYLLLQLNLQRQLVATAGRIWARMTWVSSCIRSTVCTVFPRQILAERKHQINKPLLAHCWPEKTNYGIACCLPTCVAQMPIFIIRQQNLSDTVYHVPRVQDNIQSVERGNDRSVTRNIHASLYFRFVCMNRCLEYPNLIVLSCTKRYPEYSNLILKSPCKERYSEYISLIVLPLCRERYPEYASLIVLSLYSERYSEYTSLILQPQCTERYSESPPPRNFGKLGPVSMRLGISNVSP
jgi:hypothetical protein